MIIEKYDKMPFKCTRQACGSITVNNLREFHVKKLYTQHHKLIFKKEPALKTIKKELSRELLHHFSEYQVGNYGHLTQYIKFAERY